LELEGIERLHLYRVWFETKARGAASERNILVILRNRSAAPNRRLLPNVAVSSSGELLADSSPSWVPPRRFVLDPLRQGGLLSDPTSLDEDSALAILLTARCNRLTSDATACSRLTPPPTASSGRALLGFLLWSCFGLVLNSVRSWLWPLLALCDVLCFGSKMGFAAGSFLFRFQKNDALALFHFSIYQWFGCPSSMIHSRDMIPIVLTTLIIKLVMSVLW
jgi:hypothetical protein